MSNIFLRNACASLIILTCLFSVDTYADEIRPEVRYVNGQKEIYYTNEGNDYYRNSLRNDGSTTVINSPSYPTYKKKNQSKVAKQVQTSTKKVATANKTPKKNTRRLNPDGTAEFAPPQYEVYEVEVKPRYSYYDDNWAFATFDAKKRLPRWVSNFNGREVDINPIILKYSKIWGVDPLLIEIIIRHESNFNSAAVSPVGAGGLMQLMPDTAAGLGVLNVFDVEENIAGGTRYIAAQLERFNSVPLALAAYNAGPGAVEEYGGVPPYSETQYYVDTIYGEYLAGKKKRERR